ncbi:cyanophycin synthetase [Gloeomargarita lithophora]|uniref:cyanophycin synthetase n=1 Tax=Gloeomargarita lithophora TaxID=1188228 RepID=UPI0008F893A9|nr:cyanophycin synthetase [Gloeomargarita lithophora]
MELLRILTLAGPNYWSVERPNLIVLRLDLEAKSELKTADIPGFHGGLTRLLPGLESHHCIPGHWGGFLEEVQAGTSLAHVVEHIALELQYIAGMNVGFSRTHWTATAGIALVVFEYEQAEAGRVAGRAAVHLVNTLAQGQDYPLEELIQDLGELRQIRAEAALGPSTEAIVRECEVRGIPWQERAQGMIQFGYGCYQRRIQATQTNFTSILGVELAGDKEGTKRMLAEAGIPIPHGTVIRREQDLAPAIQAVGGYPVVLKPLDGNHGRGITLDIHTLVQAQVAYDLAVAESRAGRVIVERFHRGHDHRILVVNGQVIAVAQRVPAHVTGDGTLTIAELVAQVNRDPQRGEGHDNVLTKIIWDETTESILSHQGYQPGTVLRRGEVAYLKRTANLSTGGTAVDCTDAMHPENVWLAVRAAAAVGLDIAGIDVVTTDITQPLRATDGVVVEVNAAPGFRMHYRPSQGLARNVAAPVVDGLFPTGVPHRVPIIAITGTNGKTTTTRLTAHLVKQMGKVVGFTTTDGTYVGDYLVEPGDNTGPQSARLILNDPLVQVAVLESARGGILRSGLAFAECDVGVVLNVAADHLGSYDIDTIDEMAKVKGVVAEVVRPGGTVVLNADDGRVAAMAERSRGRVAYFSLHADNPILRTHRRRGGLAAGYDQGELWLYQGDWTSRILRAVEVPLTLGGRVPFMIANALAATLAAFAQGVTLEQIRQGLRTFTASATQTPGRMNLIPVGAFHALVDYAHNPHGYAAVADFVRSWHEGLRIGVIGGPGDRRDEDLVQLGEIAGRVFDWVIIKEDDDRRGRSWGEAAELIRAGLTQTGTACRWEMILDETTAIRTALSKATPGSLVVVFPEQVKRALELMRPDGHGLPAQP